MGGDAALSRSQQERARHDLRHAAFAKAGAELYLERVSDEMALIRLNIGHMSFGIGQPRNGTEAVSVLRTFCEALTDLLVAAVAWHPIEDAPENTKVLVATRGGWVDTASEQMTDQQGGK